MLSMDAVEAAKSGHPGMPMGMADIAEVLWNDYLKFNPANGHWHDRDRFVLSNGHGSMLLYSIAYLTGYDIGLDELKNFRQLGSRVAGHPERELTLGIETTTGPLGQGLANAVGMALAEKHLAAEFNRPGSAVVDHYTYVFLGDGCLMEGISHEACSFAGTHKLGKLDRLLRRQRHLDRRRDARLVHGRHAEAFRSVRLARRAERRRARSGRGPARDRRGARRKANARR